MASNQFTGSFSGSSKNLASIVLQVSSTSDVNANTSNVAYSLLVYRNSSYLGTWKAYTPVSVTINGQVQSDTIAVDLRNVAVGSYTVVAQGTFWSIPHNANGTKTVSCSAKLDLSGTSLGTGTVSGSFKLDNIPRYVNTNLWNTGEYLDSATFSFSADASFDAVTVRVYNSSGSKIKEYSIGATTSFEVSGLSPGTRYSVDVNVRRKGTTLYKASNRVTFNTKAITTITNSINFTLGNSIPISFSNPSSSFLTLKLVAGNSTIWSANIGSVNSYTLSLDSSKISSMYNLIPNSTSGTFTLTVTSRSPLGNTYDSSKSGTFYANSGACTPSVSASSISFSDTKNVANGNIIQSQSNLRITVSGGAGSAKNGASIRTWTVNYNGVTKSANYSSGAVNFDYGIQSRPGTANISLTVTDSRGYTSSAAVKAVTVHTYSLPTLSATLNRVNGYEADVTLVINAKVATSTGFTNSIKTCTWQRDSDSVKTISAAIGKTSYNTTIEHFDTPAIDSGYYYTFKITDQLNNSTTANIFVAEGRPALIIAENGTVGIGAYVRDGNKCEIGGRLEVNDDIIIFGDPNNSDKTAYSVGDAVTKINRVDTHAFSSVVANLTSTNSSLALAASMGKQLNDKFGSYLPLSGGTVSNNLTVSKNLTVNSNIYANNNGIYFSNNGRIWSTGSQQLYFRASSETNYFLHLGVTEGMWALNPTVNEMLNLGTPNYRFGSLYVGHARANAVWVNDMLLSDYNPNSNMLSLGYGAQQNKHKLCLFGTYIEITPMNNSGQQGNVFQIIKENSGSYRSIFRSNTNGGAYLGTTSYRWNTGFFTNTITQSDRKTKNNISLLDEEKSKKFIMNLIPSSYTLKNSDSNSPRIHLGLIAQDVAEAAKKTNMGDLSMYQASYMDESGEEQPYSSNIDESKLSWGLNYNELIAPMISLIQSHEKEIIKLKREIERLCSK